MTINRDEIEYKKETPCPIDHVELTASEPRYQVLSERLAEGYKVCKKGNIASEYTQSADDPD